MSEIIVDVNGLQIRQDSIYVITHKPDQSAPSGYIEIGATKNPDLDVCNTITAPFVGDVNSGVYDTGFYEESPCYALMDKELVREKVDNLRKHIVEPYERLYGKGILDHKNLDFWDNKTIILKPGDPLHSGKINDLFDLYIAMLARELLPVSKIGDQRYNKAQYCIEDKTKMKSKKQKDVSSFVEAFTLYTQMRSSNKEGLIDILKYTGIPGASLKSTDDSLDLIFHEWVKDNTNCTRFLETVKLYQNNKTKNEIPLYLACMEMFRKGTITKSDGYFYYDNERLAGDLKVSAKYLNSKPELKDKKIKILKENFED